MLDAPMLPCRQREAGREFLQQFIVAGELVSGLLRCASGCGPTRSVWWLSEWLRVDKFSQRLGHLMAELCPQQDSGDELPTQKRRESSAGNGSGR